MGIVAALVSVALILLILMDGFETMVLPRRVTRPYRLTRFFYRASWLGWRAVACRVPPGKRRQNFLSVFGPLSILGLFALWVFGLVLGFALLHWSLATALHTPAEERPDFLTYFYLSGTTFTTLGYGDVTAAGTLGRLLTVLEAGMGFGFLAVIIGYLPVLYQAFSHRELAVALLDARAGSPPTAGQLLLRAARAGNVAAMDPFLAEWERWAAEVLEIHLSFPLLSYYRSQHDNQSWLAALTAILDTCTLLLAGVKGKDPYQAQLTFAMARHAAVDLALVFKTPPRSADPDRLPAQQRAQLRQLLSEAGLEMRVGPPIDAKIAELREMYEPFLNGLASYFLFTLPPFLPEKATVDNWQTSAWMRRVPGLQNLPLPDPGDEHFE
jgi:hypothetical protein